MNKQKADMQFTISSDDLHPKLTLRETLHDAIYERSLALLGGLKIISSFLKTYLGGFSNFPRRNRSTWKFRHYSWNSLTRT